MEIKDIWVLLSGVSDYIEDITKKLPSELLENFKPILIEKTQVVIDNENNVRIFYDNKEQKIPQFFWPAMTNTDSYSFEKILIEAGVQSILNVNDVAAMRSKTVSYARLAKNGIRIPKSLIFFEKSDKKRITETFEYPFVIKPDNGTGGAGVMLIHNDAELDEYMENLTGSVTYIAQEYIASSKGRDLRVVMLGGKKLFAIVRSAATADEFRSNVHLGGTIKEVDIDEDTHTLCKKIAGLYDLDLIGIDLLYAEDGFIVAEVNSFPGIMGEVLPYLNSAAQYVIGNFIEKKKNSMKDDR